MIHDSPSNFVSDYTTDRSKACGTGNVVCAPEIGSRPPTGRQPVPSFAARRLVSPRKADSHAYGVQNLTLVEDVCEIRTEFRLALRLAGMTTVGVFALERQPGVRTSRTQSSLRIRFAPDANIEAMDGVTLRDRDV